MTRPFVAITCSVDDKDARVRRAYVDAVVRCGGLPVVLGVPAMTVGQPDVDEIARGYVDAFDAFLFTGGDDPRTERYGVPTHPLAKLVAPERQRFEEALLRALDARRETAVLGVCLGMQMMALHAGGELNQHLPDDTATHADHAGDNVHAVVPTMGAEATAGAGEAKGGGLRLPSQGAPVASWHHQAVRSPGRLRIAARAHDGVIEAVEDVTRKFYVGVQWHPERTSEAAAGDDVIRALVEAARG
ncbi:MAG: gamma-glutamyl-gamma-aminobutyrate hydrolase family protein [Phycisphaerales bacterium]